MPAIRYILIAAFVIAACSFSALWGISAGKHGETKEQIVVTVNYPDMQCTYTQDYEKVIKRIERNAAKGKKP